MNARPHELADSPERSAHSRGGGAHPWFAARWMVPALIGASALAGCSTSPQDVVERPEGSRALVMNQPTRIEDYVVVASNISADSAVISVWVDGPAEMADVAPGEQATVNGFTFSLIEINVDPDGEDAPPGGDRTTVWILPTG